MSEQPDDDTASPPRAPADPSGPASRAVAPAQHQTPEPRRVRLRRAPRYRAFVFTGVLAGLVIALVLSAVTADSVQPTNRSVLVYLVLILALVGGVIGGGLALLVERPRRGGR